MKIASTLATASIAFAALLSASAQTTPAAPATFTDALAKGTVSLTARVRY